MCRNSQPGFALPAAMLLALLFSSLPAVAQGGLQTINPPGGGKIMYGQVTGQTTEAGAMGAVLHSLHASLGEKPQVGKLFQVHGTDSYAVFFNVNRHDQGPGKTALKISGLLIAVKVSDGHVEAALVSDDASRFPTSLSPMMKTLMSAWHPLASGRAVSVPGGERAPSGSNGHGAPPAQLHQVVLQDRSASISLPDGWQLLPNQSAMGSIAANGPNGEGVALGSAFGAIDTNNPRGRQTMQTVQNGGLRNTVYASAFYYPHGGNLAHAFLDFFSHARQKAGLPPVQFNFTSSAPMNAAPGVDCAHMSGTSDFGDGKGQREVDILFCENPPGPVSGSYTALAYSYSVPIALADKERATLGAILQSFSVNQQVLRAEIGQISGPAILKIHEIGKMVSDRIDATHKVEDIHNRSVEKHWDSIDRRSQEFENYQLGYAVVADTQNNAHGTLWADDAALLVEKNPDKYEYVNAPNYWKGIDY